MNTLCFFSLLSQRIIIQNVVDAVMKSFEMPHQGKHSEQFTNIHWKWDRVDRRTAVSVHPLQRLNPSQILDLYETCTLNKIS